MKLCLLQVIQNVMPLFLNIALLKYLLCFYMYLCISNDLFYNHNVNLIDNIMNAIKLLRIKVWVALLCKH